MTTRHTYQHNDLHTASPQKLQLMLIEGAIRFSRQAIEQLQAEEWTEACDSLARAKQVVLEVIAGVKVEPGEELARKVADIYFFVFRKLVEAQIYRSEDCLNEALRVLEIERQTWLEVGQKISNSIIPAPHISPLPDSYDGERLNLEG